jgi:hypothetical protein
LRSITGDSFQGASIEALSKNEEFLRCIFAYFEYFKKIRIVRMVDLQFVVF